jgi:hypothetical protein
MRIKLPEGVKLKRRTWGHEVWLNDVVIGSISRDEDWDAGDDNDKHIRYWHANYDIKNDNDYNIRYTASEAVADVVGNYMGIPLMERK